MNSPSYVDQVQNWLSWEEKTNIKVVVVLYIEEICCRSPWPASNQKQSIITECLSQVNTQARNSGMQSTKDTFDIRNQVSYMEFIALYLIMMTQQLDCTHWFQFPWSSEVMDCWTH